jgi:hypothetical protein
MPPTIIAGRLFDNREPGFLTDAESATNNRPAKVAMGRMDTSTAGPDRTAARLTDARSLAVPAPDGTSIPTETRRTAGTPRPGTRS